MSNVSEVDTHPAPWRGGIPRQLLPAQPGGHAAGGSPEQPAAPASTSAWSPTAPTCAIRAARTQILSVSPQALVPSISTGTEAPCS